MELHDFIAETLVQIQEGVQTALDKRKGQKGAINPVFGQNANAHEEKHVQKLEFDIAVTVSDKKSGTAKGSLQVVAASLNGDASLSREDSTVSRIKFSVPFIPPTTIVMREE